MRKHVDESLEVSEIEEIIHEDEAATIVDSLQNRKWDGE